MTLQPIKLPGAYLLKINSFADERGSFNKIFAVDFFTKAGLESNFVESYYTFSHQNVIRGMHFQLPPHDHAKLVYVPAGRVLDVILDLRFGSPTYQQFVSFELSSTSNIAIYIPRGFAHGFASLAENSCVTYLQSSLHADDVDVGIRYDSFGMNWPETNPILSKRDQSFPSLADFQTPFRYLANT